MFDEYSFVFDIDGTLCPIKKKDEKYEDLVPYREMVDKLRFYHDNGARIVLFTSRNMNSYNGNMGLINKNTAKVLISWLDKWEIPTVTAGGGKQILPDIAASVAGYRRDHNIPDEALLGLGIGVPGPVDSSGTVNRCVNLGWGVFNIAKELSDLTGLPVKAGNDANVAALGEYWKGGGQGCENIVFVTLGTGVGGGIIVEGRLLHGTHGSGAELGHMVLDARETAVCGCGKRGCVEQYCSATGIVRLAKLRLDKDEASSSLRALTDLT